ncbi:hypothetical protein [uncultured Brevundimonas sp.]|nr:hypothetical protein [uncultured Brevundimonas sp.]
MPHQNVDSSRATAHNAATRRRVNQVSGLGLRRRQCLQTKVPGLLRL